MAVGYKIGQPIMMQLGAYQFGISTAAYQELQRTASYTWAIQDRFGQMAALQYTGPGDDTMSLPGVIYPEWRGGLGQVDQMRALAGLGLPQRMVDGSGASLGLWVIETVDETQTIFADAGVPRRIEFTLSLRRAPEPAAAAAAAAPGAAEAGGLNATIPTSASGAVAKLKGLAGNVSSAAASLTGTLNKAAAQVEQTVAPIAAAGREALGGVLRATAVVTELQTVANHALGMVGVRPLDITALAGAENLAARAAGLVVSAESASALLRNSSARLGAIGAIPADATKAMQAAQAAADRTVALTRQTAAQAATIKE